MRADKQTPLSSANRWRHVFPEELLNRRNSGLTAKAPLPIDLGRCSGMSLACWLLGLRLAILSDQAREECRENAMQNPQKHAGTLGSGFIARSGRVASKTEQLPVACDGLRPLGCPSDIDVSCACRPNSRLKRHVGAAIVVEWVRAHPRSLHAAREMCRQS